MFSGVRIPGDDLDELLLTWGPLIVLEELCCDVCMSLCWPWNCCLCVPSLLILCFPPCDRGSNLPGWIDSQAPPCLLVFGKGQPMGGFGGLEGGRRQDPHSSRKPQVLPPFVIPPALGLVVAFCYFQSLHCLGFLLGFLSLSSIPVPSILCY